jgi:chemotaxis signal transduction protein
MVAGQRARRLMQLQSDLLTPSESAGSQHFVLPFDVEGATGAQTLALPFAEVSRIILLDEIVRVPGCQAPTFVLGVAPAEQEILTVVDAGLLFGGGQTTITLKSRLVVFAGGEMSGLGLFVPRVRDLVERSTVASGSDILMTSARELALRIRSQAERQVHDQEFK